MLMRHHMHKGLQRIPSCEVVGCGGCHLALETAEARVALEQVDQRLGYSRIQLQLATLASRQLDGAVHACRPTHRKTTLASNGGGVTVVVELHLIKCLLVHKLIDEAHVGGPKDERGADKECQSRLCCLITFVLDCELVVSVTIAVLDEDGWREQVGDVEQPIVDRLAFIPPAAQAVQAHPGAAQAAPHRPPKRRGTGRGDVVARVHPCTSGNVERRNRRAQLRVAGCRACASPTRYAYYPLGRSWRANGCLHRPP
eukprot:7391682-Prymnesium_polylepis.3